MKIKSSIKKISIDFLYTVGAVIILNIVQQLIIQPLINRLEGPEFLGDVLYYMGLTYYFSQKFGAVLGHQRLLHKNDADLHNSDYLAMFWMYAAISFLIGGIDAYQRTHSPAFALAMAVFMVLCQMRYYAQVEFRITVNFKGYLIYFIILSAGYVLGLIIFLFWRQWLVVFVIGEFAAVMYVVKKGTVLRFDGISSQLKKLIIPTSLLVFSFLLSGTEFLDRLLIKPIMGSLAVTEYYAISLTSRIVHLLVNPISALMLSYMADRETSTIDLKGFKKIILLCLPLFFVVTLMCCLVTPLVVHILYPNLEASVSSLNIITNVGSIMGFAADLLLVFLLAESTLNSQLMIRGAYFVVYIVLSIWLTRMNGLLGYSNALIFSNTVKLGLAVVCGIVHYSRKAKSGVADIAET